MADLQSKLESILRDATVAALGDAYADADPLVTPAKDARFGDYQANLAMGLAKRAGRKPREIAEAIVRHLGHDALSKADVAGPGFINLTLNDALLSGQAASMLRDDRLGVEAVADPQTVVIDYASPNLAKEMHIGHLRSTIIGDAIARVLGFQGQHIIRQNHIGDWGTQFGLLLEHLIDTDWQHSADQTIGDLNALYQEASRREDNDADFARRARQRVVALQSGDEQARTIWKLLIGESVRHMNQVFDRLGVQLTDADLAPESFYNDRLASVVDALDQQGLLHDHKGAKAVFVDGFKDRDGNPLPMAVRKADGGFGYPATDLAAVYYRIDELHADRVIYVVDSRQKDHFAQFFQVARQAGWAGDGVRLEHVGFGTIMGKDRKPFKTRTGEIVKLGDVLDEAVERAAQVVAAKNPELDNARRDAIARVVGIGAVKYADLSNDRIKDYVFDWDRMLALEGNTAPYLIYAYVRIRSIFRKGGVDPASVAGASVVLTDPTERALILKLSQLPRVIESVADSLEPHRLCTYLYEVASLYHQFNHTCPVLKAEDAATRDSRLALSWLVARTLKLGLGLLGIGVVEQM